MARLIDADVMKNNIMEAMMRQFEKNGDQLALRIAEMMWHFIDVTDTVDAVPVVRCKGCKYYEGFNNACHCHKADENGTPIFVREDDFCSYGKSRTDGAIMDLEVKDA